MQKKSDILWKKRKYLLSLVVLLAIVLYGNTLNHGYVLDDHSVILNHAHVQNGIAGIPEIFTTNYRHGQGGFNDGLYRPLSLFTFALEWEWFAANPFVPHLINILLYALGCALLFLALSLLFNSYPLVVPLAISLLFLSHPLHTEVVANIKGRDELLAFLGFSACLYFFSRHKLHTKWEHLFLALFFYLIALFSKESAVTYAFIIPLILLMDHEMNRKKILQSFLFLLPLALGFIVLHQQMISSMQQAVDPGNFSLLNNPIAATENVNIRWGSTFALQLLFLGKLIFPFSLQHDYSYQAIELVSFTAISSILGILIFIFLSGFTMVGLFRKNKWGIIAGIYLLSIGVASQLIRPIGVHFAERMLFLAVLPLSIFVILGLYHWGKKAKNIRTQKRLMLFSGLLIFIFGIQTFQRNKAWANNLSLYQADIHKASKSARANYNLGTELSEVAKTSQLSTEKRKLLQKAASHLQKAIRIYPDYLDAYNNLGIVYKLLGNYKKAIKVYLANIKNDPEYSKNYYNLATAYRETKQYQKAIQSMQEYLNRNPNQVNAYLFMGKMAGELKNFEQAIVYLEKGIQLAPNNIDILNYLGMAHGMLSQHQKAETYFQKAIRLNPNQSSLLINLAMSYGQQGKLELEKQILRKVLEIDPTDQTAKNRLQLIQEQNQGKGR